MTVSINKKNFRVEHDLIGSQEIKHTVYYGIQTHRAMQNFPITGVPLSHYPLLIQALAMVKLAAAKANNELNQLPDDLTQAIMQACREIINGEYHRHFTVDMIQGGAGTSTNMNANEVIANRALEILGYEKGDYIHCHPNNHVNLSQSTNDAYPSALKIALMMSNVTLTHELKGLIHAFELKGNEFKNIIKIGRTQLQDAVPITLGLEFDAYAATLEEEIDRLDGNAPLFLELNMGGTAIGTGLNTEPGYANIVVQQLKEISGFPVIAASNLVESTQDTGAFVMYSSALKRMAVKLSKICNDLRLLSSGPEPGFDEINLPKVQPGSTIMPGKVNPVIPEVVNQIAFKVIGNDLTITMAAEAGQLQLNAMLPVIAQSLFESMEMLGKGMNTLNRRCVSGITANEKRCRSLVENSIGLVTALGPELGYECCSKLAKRALKEDKSIYDLVMEEGLLSEDRLKDLLNIERMVGSRVR